jgi:hypothetical protein
MRALLVTGAVVGMALSPVTSVAAPLDGATPMLCALNSLVECDSGDCERTTAEETKVPPFVRIDVQKKVLTSADGSRTSPIAQVQRTEGRLMLQGMQGVRIWGAVINEQTGQMSAVIGDADGAIVIAGACIVP